MSRRTLHTRLADHGESVSRSLERAADEELVRRVWDEDHTLWDPDPQEIADRLGWLRVADAMTGEAASLQTFSREVLESGIEQVVLLGMGGSSLAPELFSRVFGHRGGEPEGGEEVVGSRQAGPGLPLGVVDSTDPEEVARWEEGIPLSSTLFLVSSKSGSTVETLSLFKYFYNRVAEGLGPEQAGPRFAAVTDPGSRLAEMGSELGFREVFLNDPDIGGRYSALSFFGLVPAVLCGVRLQPLLERARAGARACGPEVPVGENPGLELGVILGTLAREGCDKLTLTVSEAIAPFASWAEQLIAESTGKSGKGILPVVGEPLGPPGTYGPDRLFVDLALPGDGARDAALDELAEAGHPVVRLEVEDLYDLGRHFFLWEFATAVAGWRMGIQPFDQPDVEAAKVRAREMLDRYRAEGCLPAAEPLTADGGVALYADPDDLGRGGDEDPARTPSSAAEGLQTFIDQAGAGRYLALQAYLPKLPAYEHALERLQEKLRDLTGCPVTWGWGPRYLHSTGQLHKGDGGEGLFIQITAEHRRDVPIPDEAGSAASRVGFGALIDSQALGDRRALHEAGRQVIRLHLEEDPEGALEALAVTD
ncbi:MAG: glucose-6-phosphate isomerase [bacterium]